MRRRMGNAASNPPIPPAAGAAAARGCAMLAVAGLALGVAAAGHAAGNPYAELRAAEVKRCGTIDRKEYQTGLFLNPEGHRSLYVRSACFQDAAVKFRDAALCANVKQRRALFSSSWGYSERRCRQLVGEGIARDRMALLELRRRYAAGAVTLRDFRVERNGNGRDYDVIPELAAGYAHGYALRFDIVAPEAGAGGALLAASGFHLKGGERIRLYVPQAELRARFPAFEPGRAWRVRATLTLDVGYGGAGGLWSDAFIAQAFPVAERSKVMVKEVLF